MNFDDTCPPRAAGSTSASSAEGPEGSLPSEINQPESSRHIQSREIHRDREKNRYFQVWGERRNGKFFVFNKYWGVGPLMDQNLVVRTQQWESERREEANVPWVMQPAFAFQGISQKEREREKERKRETERKRERKKERKKASGTKALMEHRCFKRHGVSIYTVLQGSYSQQRWRLKFQTYKTQGDPC